MTMAAEAFSGGFSSPVFNAQSVFRQLMDAMAKPGTIMNVAGDAAPPAPLGLAAGSIALALCDHDTPVWLSAGLSGATLSAWLGFHTGAPPAQNKSDAAFAFLDRAESMTFLSGFSLGTQEYPDRSTTLVVEIDSLEGGRTLCLTGPGIRTATRIAPLGLPNTFVDLWAENRALFPRGVDLVLTAESRFLCLPRSTKIEAKEG